jgi:hypothetical protein
LAVPILAYGSTSTLRKKQEAKIETVVMNSLESVADYTMKDK